MFPPVKTEYHNTKGNCGRSNIETATSTIQLHTLSKIIDCFKAPTATFVLISKNCFISDFLMNKLGNVAAMATDRCNRSSHHYEMKIIVQCGKFKRSLRGVFPEPKYRSEPALFLIAHVTLTLLTLHNINATVYLLANQACTHKHREI